MNAPTATAGLEPFFHWLVRLMNPKLIVELGVDFAGATIELARYNKGRTIGIDHFKGDEHAGFRDTEYDAWKNVRESGVFGIDLRKKDFHEAATEWDQGPIDILFIDGRHGYEDVKSDFTDWVQHVRIGGIVMLHDTQSFANDVGRFYRELVYPKFEITHSHGLGVVLKT